MGIMFPNRDLRVALAQTAEKAENLTRFQPDRALHVDRDADGVTLTLAGGETIHGALLVAAEGRNRSEEHTSELQSLMRISYAVFCLKKKRQNNQHTC